MTDIAIDRDGDKIKIKIASDSIVGKPNIFKLTEPLRYVIDIPSAVIDFPAGTYEVNSDVIEKIRYSQYSVSPKSVRFVVDAKKETSISHEYAEGFFIITVNDDNNAGKLLKAEINENDKKVSFSIDTDRNLEYTTYKLSNPTRYYVEFENAVFDIPLKIKIITFWLLLISCGHRIVACYLIMKYFI